MPRYDELRFVSETHRAQFNERRKFEWRIVFAILTFYGGSVLAIHQYNIEFPNWKISLSYMNAIAIALILLAFVVIYVFWGIHGEGRKAVLTTALVIIIFCGLFYFLIYQYNIRTMHLKRNVYLPAINIIIIAYFLLAFVAIYILWGIHKANALNKAFAEKAENRIARLARTRLPRACRLQNTGKVTDEMLRQVSEEPGPNYCSYSGLRTNDTFTCSEKRKCYRCEWLKYRWSFVGQSSAILMFAFASAALVYASTVEIAKEKIEKLGKHLNANDFTTLAGEGNVFAVDLFLSAGQDPNELNTNGSTALIEATKEKHIEIVRYLLKEGKCNPNIADAKGETALVIARRENNPAVEKLLIEAGAVQ